MVDATVRFDGPLFDDRFAMAAVEITVEAQEAVTAAVLERVQFFLDAQIKHPTPYYETQITKQRRGLVDIVHDRGIIYGPWLEGTSSRNATTRFKGYASFRKATQAAQKLAPMIVGRIVAKNLWRLR